MRVKNDGKDRKAEGKRNEGGRAKGSSRSLATLPRTGAEYGTYQVGASREDSQASDTFVLGRESIEGIAGKLISQLINEAEKQLAYHDQQSQLLKSRIEELRQLSESTD
jgi:hypothetical protein